jgi:hypothetical protein
MSREQTLGLVMGFTSRTQDEGRIAEFLDRPAITRGAAFL